MTNTESRRAELAAEVAHRRDPTADEAPPAGGRQSVERARDALLELQHSDGHWCFELEADCTIPAELVLCMHFTDEVDETLQAKLAAFLRSEQTASGGWPLYFGGELDLSCSVKAYWALKLAGDDPDADHMRRAREAILARGGAARSNVFTRIAMALFGEVPWRAAPFLPVEIILLPSWFPFHLSKVSYWSRTVMMPLAVLTSLRARAANPTGRGIRELFVTPPEEERRYHPTRSFLNRVFLAIERTARLFEPLIPGFVRRRALKRAESWFVARLNGEDGLGGIFPAMVNAYEALLELGHSKDEDLVQTCRKSIYDLVVERDGAAYCQPCKSPVWDTALAALALQETDRALASSDAQPRVRRSLEWLEARQILDGPADWREARPELPPGGWAFQYRNDFYPDLDDTSVVVWAMVQDDPARFATATRRAADWLAGMQSKNGGFAAFDADNTYSYLNEIPFADHGALLDPPTSDVTARCVRVFAMLDRAQDKPVLEHALAFLDREQEPGGAWFGRWGTNYVYGTWSVLSAIEPLVDVKRDERVRRAVRWLHSVQRDDGSFGETNDSYVDEALAGRGERATAVHTAWALLALLAAGEADSAEARRAALWLEAHQGPDGHWDEPDFNAPGFPRVFYLRYHGYAKFFPLWALARFHREAGRTDGSR